MCCRLPHALLGLAGLAAYFATFTLAAVWQRKLEIPLAEGGVEVFGQESGGEGGAGQTFQRTRRGADGYFAEYGFRNFNRDLLTVRFSVSRKAFEEYDAGFGYTKADLDAIDEWHNTARQGAYQYAVKQKKGQGAIDAAMANLKLERDRKVKEYMSSRGFKLLPGNVVRVDMPLIVRQNAPQMKNLALAFETIATERRYDSESLIGAVTSMVQTALTYRIPPTSDGAKHTGGLLPPMKAIVSGWGDCDTKTGLLASILANWPHMRMVGLAVPSHYLMAVLRIPGKGDMFIEHGGLQYVLIEPAGPAWLPPGTVSEGTVSMLQAAEGYNIEPFF